MDWTKEVKKALIDKNITQKELADALGYSRQYVCNIINGVVTAQPAMDRVADYLGIEREEE